MSLGPLPPLFTPSSRGSRGASPRARGPRAAPHALARPPLRRQRRPHGRSLPARAGARGPHAGGSARSGARRPQASGRGRIGPPAPRRRRPTSGWRPGREPSECECLGAADGPDGPGALFRPAGSGARTHSRWDTAGAPVRRAGVWQETHSHAHTLTHTGSTWACPSQGSQWGNYFFRRSYDKRTCWNTHL